MKAQSLTVMHGESLELNSHELTVMYCVANVWNSTVMYGERLELNSNAWRMANVQNVSVMIDEG